MHELGEFDLAQESDQVLLEKVNFDETSTHLDKSFFKLENSEEKSSSSCNSNSNKRRLSRSVELHEEESKLNTKKQSRSMSSDANKLERRSAYETQIDQLKHMVPKQESPIVRIKENKQSFEINENSSEPPQRVKTQSSKEHVSKIPVRSKRFVTLNAFKIWALDCP